MGAGLRKPIAAAIFRTRTAVLRVRVVLDGSYPFHLIVDSSAESRLAHTNPAVHVCFVNRFYAPDQSATAQLLTELAEHLVSGGHSVTVLTSDLSYDGSTLRAGVEPLRGVRVVRVRTTKFGRARSVGRAIDYLTFYLAVGVALLRELRASSVCVAKTDPPLIAVLCGLACVLKGAKLVNWVQDRFPEIALELGYRLPFGTHSIAKSLRDWSSRTAVMNVAIGGRMAQAIAPRGSGVKCTVIPNWAVGDLRPIAPDASVFRKELNLRSDQIVVGYSGNLGQAHQWEAILALASSLLDTPEIVFLVVGGGDGYAKLRAHTEHLPNVVFKPYQPLSELSDSLAAVDLHMVLLKPEMEGLIVPSKIYGILAVERPILFVGDREGEVGRLISADAAGWVYPDTEIEPMAQRLRSVAASPSELLEVQINAAKLHHREFAAEASLMLWKSTLEALSDAAATDI